MDEFEKEEMNKSRPVLKNKLNKWYGWLVDVLKPFKNVVSKKILRLKITYDGVKETLNGDVAENPLMPESWFTLDKIMHLYINFHRLALTRGGSYTELPEWLKSKKAVINPQNKDEECFKWAAIAALHHEEIKNKFERISLLKPYENRYNWKGLEFPVSIKKIDKFEENNPGIAVNVLFNNKKNQDIYTARRSERNVKCKK